MHLSNLRIFNDAGAQIPTSGFRVSGDGPGRDDVPEGGGSLTKVSPTANLGFVPDASGDLHYDVRTSAGGSTEAMRRVEESEVGTELVIYGIARFDYDSTSETQAAEISLRLDQDSWLVAELW